MIRLATTFVQAGLCAALWAVIPAVRSAVRDLTNREDK